MLPEAVPPHFTRSLVNIWNDTELTYTKYNFCREVLLYLHELMLSQGLSRSASATVELRTSCPLTCVCRQCSGCSNDLSRCRVPALERGGGGGALPASAAHYRPP